MNYKLRTGTSNRLLYFHLFFFGFVLLGQIGCETQVASKGIEVEDIGNSMQDDSMILVAEIDLNAWGATAGVVSEILGEAGIAPEIEGSLLYGVAVKKRDAKRSIQLLREDKRLKVEGFRIKG